MATSSNPDTALTGLVHLLSRGVETAASDPDRPRGSGSVSVSIPGPRNPAHVHSLGRSMTEPIVGVMPKLDQTGLGRTGPDYHADTGRQTPQRHTNLYIGRVMDNVDNVLDSPRLQPYTQMTS